MNYRITLAYDGTDYHGWQMQADQRTVQGVLEEVLQRLAGKPVKAHGAGRTDAGVHAEGQVVSFRLEREWEGSALRRALNANLPLDVRVTLAEPVADDFHARLHAHGKTYRYQLYCDAVMHPLWVRYAWHFPYTLDAERLRTDAVTLLGKHDFTAFTVTSCETSTRTRTLTNFHLEIEDKLWRFWFSGDGFIRYQVRTMIGALVAANRGRLPAGSMTNLLASRDRKLAGAAAPAHGLTLVKVEY
jgi:tRNA pseudouridine38-40 synthase